MDELKKVNNPHDLYFKSTFGKLDFAKDFLNNYLPKELISIIDIETLTYEPTTYLNKELKKQFADLVYKINLFYSKDENLKLEKEHAIVLETLSKVRYESKEEIIEIFKRAIEIYTKTKDRDIISHYITETIVYIISTRDDFDETELKDIAEQISKEGGELFMTLAERLIEEGEQKRAGEIAKELLLNGMGIDLVAKYTKLSKKEIEEIQAVIRK